MTTRRLRAFISYRREDTAGEAVSLELLLNQMVGSFESVYRDRSKILPGDRWPENIRAHLAAADIVFVVVGPRWLHSQNVVNGKQRITEPGDWVRREIELALELDKPIVQLLINGASPFTKDHDLPSSIDALRDIQAVPIDFDELDVAELRLAKAIRRVQETLAHSGPGSAVGLVNASSVGRSEAEPANSEPVPARSPAVLGALATTTRVLMLRTSAARLDVVATDGTTVATASLAFEPAQVVLASDGRAALAVGESAILIEVDASALIVRQELDGPDLGRILSLWRTRDFLHVVHAGDDTVHDRWSYDRTARRWRFAQRRVVVDGPSRAAVDLQGTLLRVDGTGRLVVPASFAGSAIGSVPSEGWSALDRAVTPHGDLVVGLRAATGTAELHAVLFRNRRVRGRRCAPVGAGWVDVHAARRSGRGQDHVVLVGSHGIEVRSWSSTEPDLATVSRPTERPEG